LIFKGWLSVKGFTRIIIPDTFIYYDIINFNNPIYSILESTVKNTIGPSFIWYITDGNWIETILINSFFVYISLYFFEKIAIELGSDRKSMLIGMTILAICPSTIYYSIGALKELPTVCFTLAFLYYYITSKKIKLCFFAFLLFLFRYQFVFIFLLFFFFEYLDVKKSFIILILIAFLFPAFKHFNMLGYESSLTYRLDSGNLDSLGYWVEYVRNNIFVLSFFGILVRIFQSLFEPFLAFLHSFSFYENNLLSVIKIILFSSLILFTPYIYCFFKNFIFFAFAERKIKAIFIFICISTYFIGGFSFIHHRYLVFIFPLMILLCISFSLKKENF
jgi:hypothetical protein